MCRAILAGADASQSPTKMHHAVAGLVRVSLKFEELVRTLLVLNCPSLQLEICSSKRMQMKTFETSGHIQWHRPAVKQEWSTGRAARLGPGAVAQDGTSELQTFFDSKRHDLCKRTVYSSFHEMIES